MLLTDELFTEKKGLVYTVIDILFPTISQLFSVMLLCGSNSISFTSSS